MIKRISIALAALALAACTALGLAGTAASVLAGAATPASIQATGDKVVLKGTQALIIAHLTYQSVGEAALAGRRTGLISDAQWATVKQYDNVVYSYLQKGDAAQSGAEKAANAASALDAIYQLKALLPSSLFGGH
jgi:hypothetical protein